jgi:hypothetical protein
MTPATARDLATITDPAATAGQLADVLYRRAVSWGSGVNATDLSPDSWRNAKTSDLLAQAAHARLHEQQPCAGGCRRQVWPACGELCEECWRREEELERVRGYLAEAVADEHKIGPYVKVAPGVFDELTPEGWAILRGSTHDYEPAIPGSSRAALAAAEARGRQAGLLEAAASIEQHAALQALAEPAQAAYENAARWLRQRAEE